MTARYGEPVATFAVASTPQESRTPSLDAPAEPRPSAGTRRSDRIAQAVVLAVVLASPAIICAHTAFIGDPDMWWHLRTGEWILQHHDVPHTEPFSRLAGTPWIAYSWLFEVALLKLYQWLGLVGMITYSCGMVLASVVALNHMVRRLQADFTLIALLTFVPMYSMGQLFTPRPWLFTILFFALEMNILTHARRTGAKRELLWLPLIFALWANVHIEFVDGLFVLGLAFAEAVTGRWWKSAQRQVGPWWLGAALLASAIATLVNPYGWRIYAVAHDLATQSGALNTITELQAMPFRSLSDFAVLALALGAAATLGWKKKLASFDGALLAFATVLAFRSQRDVWMLAIVAAAILAAELPPRKDAVPRPSTRACIFASGLAVLLVVGVFRLLHMTNQNLEHKLSLNMPVKAVEVVRERGYTGPIYNHFTWGGYLIWHLRMPVEIDGRQNVYGDQAIERSVQTWGGAPDWASDPQLATAHLVIGPVGMPLVQLLRLGPHFQLVYEDKVAAVFVARQ